MGLFFIKKKDKKSVYVDKEEEQRMLIKDISTLNKCIISVDTKKDIAEFTELLSSILRITETKPQILAVRTFFSTICKDMYVHIKDYIRLQHSFKTNDVELQMNKQRQIIKEILEIAKDIYKKQLISIEMNLVIALLQLEKIKDYSI